jgi:hypothetical protein
VTEKKEPILVMTMLPRVRAAGSSNKKGWVWYCSFPGILLGMTMMLAKLDGAGGCGTMQLVLFHTQEQAVGCWAAGQRKGVRVSDTSG